MTGTLQRPPMGSAPPKPSRIGGKLDKAELRAERQKAKQKADKAQQRKDAAKWKQIRLAVYLRDGRRCRAFGLPLLLETDNLKKLAEVHHLTYRSAGGTDTLDNLVCLSLAAHRMEHESQLEISGDPNVSLKFTQYEFRGGTRQFVRTWTSPCPSALPVPPDGEARP